MTPVSVLYHSVRNHFKTVALNNNYIIILVTELIEAALLGMMSAGAAVIWGLDWTETSKLALNMTGALVKTARRLSTAGTLGQLGVLSFPMWSQSLFLSIWPSYEVSLCGLSSRVATLLTSLFRIPQRDIYPIAHYISVAPQILYVRNWNTHHVPQIIPPTLFPFPEVEAAKSSQDLVPQHRVISAKF